MQSAPRSNPAAQDNIDQVPSWREVFLHFLTLGFINIGGLTLILPGTAAPGLWPST